MKRLYDSRNSGGTFSSLAFGPNDDRSYSEAGQEKAREFAGQEVKITGRITGKTIRVTTIEATT